MQQLVPQTSEFSLPHAFVASVAPLSCKQSLIGPAVTALPAAVHLRLAVDHPRALPPAVSGFSERLDR